jgi:hypothetical protein
VLRLAVLALAACVALIACSEPPPNAIPPPDEIGPRITAVREAVWKSEAALNGGEIDLDKLEATVASLASRYGEQSAERIQGLTETAAMLCQKQRFDLALPFMEQTLALSRAVYGLEHRETAFGLHDVATILGELAPGAYVPRAELLYRGAVDVRRKTAGVDHPETAASEVQLAWQLLLGAKQESLPYRRQPMLDEAEQLALHAQRVFADNDDKSYWFQHHRIAIETAFAREDYAAVQQRAGALLKASDYEKGPGLYPDATAAALLAKAVELQKATLPDVERP